MMQRSVPVFVLPFAILLGLANGANATPDKDQLITPTLFADRLVSDVEHSRSLDVDRFGQDSLSLQAPEKLARLNDVAETLAIADDPRARKWADILAKEAQTAASHRYEVLARFWGAGGEAAPTDTLLSEAAEHDPDWLVRVTAMEGQAARLRRADKITGALHRLEDAEALVPASDRQTALAEAWLARSKGLALLQLQDIDGASALFERRRAELKGAGLPILDFADIYELGALAARLGDWQLAWALSEHHHHLVEGQASGENLVIARDKHLCALLAEHASPQAVLSCLQGLDLTTPDARLGILVPHLLILRATAHAHLGDILTAQHDLNALERLSKSGKYPMRVFDDIPLVRAVLARAQHKDAAFDILMDYYNARRSREAQHFQAGLGQVMQDQAVRDLRSHMAEHRWFDTAAGVLVSLLGLLAVWQLRGSAELKRARRTAEQANRAKGEFLANMSHEIRTPLNGVVAVADMLARAELPHREHQMAEMIRSSGDTLQRLLSDILDVARIESGQLTIEAAPFQAGDMARAVAAIFQLKCEEKGILLTAKIAPEVDRMVLGDMLRVRQIVTNLLSNAVKFTETGHIHLNAERLPDGSVRFMVIDTGIGFDMADKAKILGRFEQADTSITRRYGGSGLGLAICRDLASRMGGHLGCGSSPGLGSRFWVDLPLAPVEIEAANAPTLQPELPDPENQSLPNIQEAPPTNDQLRILLADDHPTNRAVVELILNKDLAKLTSVENGAQAVDAFKTEAFDLILMDMQMPVMDGLAAIAEIRRLELSNAQSRTPIIMLTANTMPEHISVALSAGADLHLAKPLTANGLFEAIETVLGGEAAHGVAA